MDKITLVSEYHIAKHNYKTVHSASNSLYFNKPCIGYVTKGYAKFLYDGKTVFANKGDLIYIAVDTRYQSIWYGSPDIQWYSVNFDYSSKYAYYNYRFQIIKNYPPELFEAMYNAFDTSPLISVSYFYRLLDDIFGKMEHSNTSRLPSSIAPAVKYIENNYNKPMAVDTLAELCHISRSSLFNQFMKSFGVTPISYKHNLMIQKAIELLSNTDMSVEEISSHVGFSSANYFRKVFEKLTSKTPKELRKK